MKIMNKALNYSPGRAATSENQRFGLWQTTCERSQGGCKAVAVGVVSREPAALNMYAVNCPDSSCDFVQTVHVTGNFDLIGGRHRKSVYSTVYELSEALVEFGIRQII